MQAQTIVSRKLTGVIASLRKETAPEKVDSIDLSECYITKEALDYILKDLRRFSKIRSLNLYFNGRLEDGVARIVELFPNLESLNFGLCGVEKEHVAKIARSIEKCPNLRHLSLAANQVSQGVTTLIEAAPNLESLDISYCSIITGGDVAKALKKCRSLKSLNISNNEKLKLGISNILHACKNLQVLEAEKCGAYQEELPTLQPIFNERVRLVKYSYHTHTDGVLVARGQPSEPGIKYFNSLRARFLSGTIIRQADFVALQVRMNYVVENFDIFQKCKFDEAIINDDLKKLNEHMSLLCNWLKANAVYKSSENNWEALPDEISIKIGLYLKDRIIPYDYHSSDSQQVRAAILPSGTNVLPNFLLGAENNGISKF